MIESIGSAFNGVLAVVLVLGACVFFHELGHFVVAKLIGMRVEEFALGFGRALWGTTRGETTYRLNLIPLGGYVRIAGMEPGGEQVEHGFYSFSRWKGALVLFAGAFMNVVLAALAFIAVTLASGMGVFPNTEINIRKVLPDTPSAQADIQPGDQLIALDGVNDSLLITQVTPGGLADRAGLEDFTRIYEADGDPIDLPHQLLAIMNEAQDPPAAAEAAAEKDPATAEQAEPASSIELKVLPFTEDGQPLEETTLTLPLPPDLPDDVSAAEAGPLLERTLGVTLSPIGPNESIAYISEKPEQPVVLTLMRDGREVKTTVVPDKKWERVPSTDESGRMTAAHTAVGRIGIVLSGASRPASFGEAVQNGVARSIGAVVLTTQWLYMMIVGEVAPQASGPGGIAAVTGDQARIGWTAVASIAGLISANLAIINLLPWPPFDGFKIVLLGIEGIIRRRVNPKVEMVMTIAGVAVLLALFLIITFRDIFNLVIFQSP